MSLTSLKRIKEPPLKGEQYSLKERSGEIDDLLRQRDTLTKGVKKLSGIFFGLKEGEKKVRANVESIATERLSVISEISKEISSELKEKSNKLENKSIKLDETDVFLTELSKYLYAYAQIVEAEKLLNQRRGVLLEERVIDTSKLRKKAETLFSKAKESFKRSKRIKGTIDGRYEKVDEITKWFEEKADKEQKKIEVKLKKIGLRNKVLKSEKRHIEKEKEGLSKRLIQIIDKERRFDRVIAEFKRKGML